MIPYMEKGGRGSESDDSGRVNIGRGGVPGAGGGSSAGDAHTVAAREADAGGGSSAGDAYVGRGGSDAEELIFAFVSKAGSADNDMSFDQKLQVLVTAIKEADLLDGHIEFPDVMQDGKETVSMISDRVSSGTWLPVDARELELFTRGVLACAQVIGTEQIKRAVNEVLSGPSIRKMLQQIVNDAPQMDGVVDQAISKITPTDDPNHGTLRWLVLGSAILIAAGTGVIVPLVAGAAMAEVILTNEVAIAALAIGAAALIKQS
jgi:hypothetical protein